MSLDIQSIDPLTLVQMVEEAGGQRAFARLHGVPRTTLQDRLYMIRTNPYGLPQALPDSDAEENIFGHRPPPKPVIKGQKRGVRRFILTSAQDSTKLHDAFLTNLEAYRDWLSESGSCEILVGGFTYNKSLFSDHEKSNVVWPDRIKPYVIGDRVRIADKIDFCAEMNTLPTAENPLSGFHTYTRDRWGIFPHAKVQLVSVPSQKYAPPKQIMTTGAVTYPNYVQKKAGIKASFHHVFGAVLVEIDRDGTFFCRHLIANDEGNFYDLDRYVTCGTVTTGHALLSVAAGDVHVDQIDPVVAETTFGLYPGDVDADGLMSWDGEGPDGDSLLAVLKPLHLFIHDVADFRRRNHHNTTDPHTLYRYHVEGIESVENELHDVATFLTLLGESYPGMKTVVVESNHDEALLKWLKIADYREDPVNAEFFLRCQLAQYQAIRSRAERFSIFEYVMQTCYEDAPCRDVTFLREDDSYIVGDVEHAYHGHRGPNGARGGVASLRRLAPKMTIGHVHSPAIEDGLYASGTTSKLDMGYNRGPSSWAHTHTIQYQNGKRALITVQNGKWCVR